MPRRPWKKFNVVVIENIFNPDSDSVRLKRILSVSGEEPNQQHRKVQIRMESLSFAQIHPERVFTGFQDPYHITICNFLKFRFGK